jgi:hypothetical protein
LGLFEPLRFPEVGQPADIPVPPRMQGRKCCGATLP